jgi:RND family efflux transporter MFP subunit
MSPKSSIAKKLGKYLLPLLILAAAVAGGVWLVTSQEEPQREEPREQRVLVETAPVEGGAHQLSVRSSGEVVAARQVEVSPEVGGKIVWVNQSMVPGGILRAGEEMFRVDPRNYQATVEERRTELEQARAQLEQEKGRVEVAEQEWEIFKDEIDEGVEDPSLALREPQLRSARVAVEAAKARLDRAKIDLERTSVAAPFDAFVESEAVDLGQTVGPQTQVATLIGTGTFWVRTSVPVDKISYVNIPGVNAQQGAPATIYQDVGGRSIERQGRVAKLQGDLDPQGRMARILIEVDDPFGVRGAANPESNPTGIPLLVSSYVDVQIQGPTVENLVEVPREAVHGGHEVYVYSDDDTLDIREVDIAWERPETVLVRTGLQRDDRVVTSPIATAIEGMKLRRTELGSDEQDLIDEQDQHQQDQPDEPPVGGGPGDE